MSEDRFSVLQLSDLHADFTRSEDIARLAHIRRIVEDRRIDTIIASGDVTDDGFRRHAMFAEVRDELRTIAKSVHFLPGNHDVGNVNGSPGITMADVDAWRSAFGGDRFSFRRGRWAFVGINSEIFGSGLPCDDEQLAWMDAQLAEAAAASLNVAVFMHEPPYIRTPDESFSDASAYWGCPLSRRPDVLRLLDRPHVKLIANGHLHWHHVRMHGQALWVWCPSAVSVVDDAKFPEGGDVIGMVAYHFHGNTVTHELIDLGPPNVPAFPFGRPKVELPDRKPIVLRHLALDFTGTLSRDGVLLPGVADRLRRIADVTRITVMTADTFGTAQQALAGLPVRFQRIANGTDKLRLVESLGADGVMSIGNGRNDVEMTRATAIGVAVVGPEGAAGDLVRVADIVTRDICDALDLVLNPLRMKATLRQ